MAELYQNKDISIMCPNCNKFLTKADKRDGRIHNQSCKHCHKWIWYKPSDKSYVKIKAVPERTQGSGMRFY